MITTTKGDFHNLINKMKGLSMAQFNHIKKNNITDFEVIEFKDKHNILIYKNYKGETVSINTIGESF